MTYNDIANVTLREGKKMKHLSQKEIQDACKRYLAGETGVSIAQEYGVSFGAIYAHLRKKGVKTRPPEVFHRKYECNHGYFDDIDGQEKAYWLGFLMADGCIYKNRLTIALQEKDAVHIQLFLNSLNSSHPVHIYEAKRYESRRVVAIHKTANASINSTHLTNSLATHGVVPRKTFNLRWPDIDSSLVPHFIRGYIDGDGGFSVDQSPRFKTPQIIFYVTGYRPFIERMQEILIDECNLNKTKSRYRIKEQRKTISIQYRGNRQVKRICNYLYHNAKIYMERKYNFARLHLP